MAIVNGVGSLIVNDILTDVSYALFEGVVNTTLTSLTLAGYGDDGFGYDGGYGQGTGYVVTVPSTNAMYVGAQIIVGLGNSDEEVVTILGLLGNTFLVSFLNSHSPGETIVGATFPVRQTTDPLFTQPEMLAYISTAVNDFLTDCPLVYNVADLTITGTQAIAALPSDCQFPVRMAPYTVPVSTNVYAYPLRETSQSNLDEMVYTWQQSAATLPIAYYRDKTGQGNFGVYPKSNNKTLIECVYAQRSAQLMGLADGFLIPDAFTPIIKFRVLEFAYSKDGEMRQPALAKYFSQRYSLGVKIANVFLEAIMDPNLEMSS